MKLITRTIAERRYNVMTLNVKTQAVEIKEYSLGSMDFKGAESALKALQARFNDDTIKLVHIVSTSTVEALYAMTEEAFIKNAIQVKDVKEARAYFKANPDEVEEVEAE